MIQEVSEVLQELSFNSDILNEILKIYMHIE